MCGSGIAWTNEMMSILLPLDMEIKKFVNMTGRLQLSGYAWLGQQQARSTKVCMVLSWDYAVLVLRSARYNSDKTVDRLQLSASERNVTQRKLPTHRKAQKDERPAHMPMTGLLTSRPTSRGFRSCFLLATWSGLSVVPWAYHWLHHGNPGRVWSRG